MEVTKFEIRKDGDSHIASFTVRLNTDTDKFNDKMEEILDRTRKKLEDMHKINPGDYFIARKPKNPLEGLPWIDAMNKFDGVIQKCAYFGEDGRILSENTFMDAWLYHPSWCEKVSPGDVMKTRSGSVFIFKEVKDGNVVNYAYLSILGGLVINDNKIPGMTCSHSTSEEAKSLFDALRANGKRWNAEKMCIEDFFAPEDGDFMYSTWGEGPIGEDTAIYILRGEYKGEKEEVKYYAKINPNNKLDYNATIGTFYPRKDRFATYAEKKQLLELLATLEEYGMVWNSEKRQIEDLPKHAFTEDDLKNIGIMVAVNEIPNSNKDKPKELTESLANEGIVALNEMNKLLAEFNEILPDLKAGIMRDISYSSGKRDALKQVIKLCKKLLNE